MWTDGDVMFSGGCDSRGVSKMGGTVVDVLEVVMEGREFENILKYIQWIGKGERWLGHRGTNAFKVFESIINVVEMAAARVR
jgi:hypothetical protein